MKKILASAFVLFLFIVSSTAISGQDGAGASNGVARSPKGQATPPPTQKMDAKAFEPSNEVVVRWLGGGGFFINGGGRLLAIDPVLQDFDMPLLIEAPIDANDVPRLDATLVTHDDADHYSVSTCRVLATKGGAFYSTRHVAELMRREGLNAVGLDIGDEFELGAIRVKTTKAKHDWQNSFPGTSKRVYRLEDCCGFWLETPNGSIWAPGDTQLLPEHLTMKPAPDVICFDFSDSEWHLGFEGAVRLANAYPDAELLTCHWGTVDAPEMKEFNGDPERLRESVVKPERVRILAPGEPFVLRARTTSEKR